MSAQWVYIVCFCGVYLIIAIVTVAIWCVHALIKIAALTIENKALLVEIKKLKEQ